jgi:hypothetical protein
MRTFAASTVAAAVLVVSLFAGAGAAPARAQAEPPEDVVAFGRAGAHGSTGGRVLHRPVVDLVPTPSGRGYWELAADGGVFSYGDAGFFGSDARLERRAPAVGLAATPTGRGYWIATADGEVLPYGDAAAVGSAGGLPLAAPIVGIAATPTGRGYSLAAADGGVFTYGDAPFAGSAAGLDLAAPIVAVAATPTGLGYRLAAADGGVFTFGDAAFVGSAAGLDLAAPVVDLASTATGSGYWLAAADGGVFTFGDAPFAGSLAGKAHMPVVAVAAPPDGGGYWLAYVNVRVCDAPDFTIAYPGAWHAAGGAVPACRYLGREPVTVSGHAELRPALAVGIRILDERLDAATAGPEARELSRREETVDGRRALVVEDVATGVGLLPRGTFRYRHLVDLDGRTLVVATYDTDDTAERYRADRDIVDRMVRSLDVRTDP